MKDQLKHILNLVRKTGDTMIVTDPDGEDVYVVMDLDQYENLRNEMGFDDEMSEDQWKQYQEDRKREDDWIWDSEPIEEEYPEKIIAEKTPDIWSAMKPAGKEGDTWDIAKMAEDEVVDLEKQYKKYAQDTTAPFASKSNTELKIEQIPQKLTENNENFGEEQFYLEPIE